MEVIATSKYIRQSPQKVRQVANVIKDLPLDQALVELSGMGKKAATPLGKILRSALANAQHNHGLSKEDLRIKEIQVGPGPTLRRVRPRARGRGDVVRKRSCHIRVVLETKE